MITNNHSIVHIHTKDPERAAFNEHPTVRTVRPRLAERIGPRPLEAGWLREVGLEAGADDVGFVSLQRPELDDQREDILRTFPPARAAISFVCRMNR